MALITINAVVDIARHVVVLEIVRIVAAMAPGALEDGVVIRVDMARRAHFVGVAVGDRKLRVLGVVEGGAGPGGRIVAVLARRGEKLRLRGVPGIRSVVVIGLVAPNTRRRQGRVIVVYVAIRTYPGGNYVGPGEWEGRVVVVERRVRPNRGVMA